MLEDRWLYSYVPHWAEAPPWRVRGQRQHRTILEALLDYPYTTQNTQTNSSLASLAPISCHSLRRMNIIALLSLLAPFSTALGATGCDKACEQANPPITRGQRLHPDDLRAGPSGIGYLPAQCLINKTVHCHWVSLSEPFVQPTQRWHAQYRARVSSSNTSDKTPDPAFCPKSSVVIQFSRSNTSACQLRLFDFDDTARCLARQGSARLLIFGDSLARRMAYSLMDAPPTSYAHLHGNTSTAGNTVERPFAADPAAPDSWIAFRDAWRLDYDAYPLRGLAVINRTLSEMAGRGLDLVVLP